MLQHGVRRQFAVLEGRGRVGIHVVVPLCCICWAASVLAAKGVYLPLPYSGVGGPFGVVLRVGVRAVIQQPLCSIIPVLQAQPTLPVRGSPGPLRASPL